MGAEVPLGDASDGNVPRRMCREGERGSATVITLALIGALLAIGVALAVAAAELTAKSHAQGVADISALAAARGNSCGEAKHVLEHNPRRGLELVRCELREGYAQVEVRRAGLLEIRAVSRAGPQW